MVPPIHQDLKQESENQPIGPTTAELVELDKLQPMIATYAADDKKFEIIDGMMGIEHVGDQETRMAMKFIQHTAKGKRSQNMAIKGDPSLGKTHLINTTLRYLPSGWVQKIGRLTSNAIYYLKDEGRPILYLQELHMEGNQQYGLKLSSSDDGGFTIGYVARNPQTGEMITKFNKLSARSFVATTTSIDIDPELATRTTEFSMPNDEETTRQVVMYEALQEEAGIDVSEELNKSALAKALAAYVDTLPFKQKILMPFASKIAEKLPTADPRIRRDSKKLWALVREIARYDYLNRFRVQHRGEECIVASYTDFTKAWQLFSAGFRDTLSGLDEAARKILEACNKIPKEREFTISNITKEANRIGLKASTDTVRRRVKSLIVKGFMAEDEDASKANKIVYQLLEKVAHIADFAAFCKPLQHENLGDLTTEMRKYFLFILQDCSEDRAHDLATQYVANEERLLTQRILKNDASTPLAILQYEPALQSIISLCNELQHACNMQNEPAKEVAQ